MPITLKNIDTASWTWSNFKPKEIACSHCGELAPIDDLSPFFKESMDKIQMFRELLGVPVILNSAHRCSKHNAKVGGEKFSMHLQIAFDIPCVKKDQLKYVKLLDKAGFKGIGIYDTFVHADCGRKRWWLTSTMNTAYNAKIEEFLNNRG